MAGRVWIDSFLSRVSLWEAQGQARRWLDGFIGLKGVGVGGAGADAAGIDSASAFSTRLTPAQMGELLAKREAMMQDGAKGDGGVTDQWTITG